MPVKRSLAEQAARLLTANPTPQLGEAVAATSTARTLYEWKQNPALLEPPVTVIPHLAVEGRVSLLSGREKIGKSTLIGGAVAAASNGQPMFSVPIAGSVTTLHYNNDEPMGDTVRRYDSLGADPDSVIINDCPRSVVELLEALTVDVETFDPDLVVVDNLSRALAVSGIDPNSSHHVEPAMVLLVDFFHRRNLSAILLYHTGKSGRGYRGSTAIGAAVDEILTLRRRGQPEDDDFEDDGSDDGQRLLIQDGRNLRGRVHLSCTNGIYGLYDDAQPPREKILKALARHGSVAGRSELAKLARVRKSAGLDAIASLVSDGTLKESRKVITLADSAGSDEFPESGTQTGTTNGTSSRTREEGSVESGTKARLSEPDYLTPEEEADFFASQDWS